MSKRNKLSTAYIIFMIFNYTIVFIWVSSCILPFIHIISISLSSPGPANANIVGLWPKGFTLEPYIKAFQDKQILSSLYMSFKRIIWGVLIQMFFTILAAFPLSKEREQFPGRQVYIWIIIITMLFSGGLIPMYMLVNYLKISDTVWALVLPNAVPVFNVIILQNFFRRLPKELEESASIDGASQLNILVNIYLPLSITSLLTLVLFASVGHWNAWFDGIIYMKNPSNYPLSSYLRSISVRLTTIHSVEDAKLLMRMSQRSLLMAYTVICTVPIAIIYPILQRYVKAGLIVGSVKG